MILEGTMKDGVVVLDNGHTLAEGTRVRVTALTTTPATETPPPTLIALLEVAGSVDDLPADMARNHDHYLHGARKR